jgi:hypothetical protein
MVETLPDVLPTYNSGSLQALLHLGLFSDSSNPNSPLKDPLERAKLRQPSLTALYLDCPVLEHPHWLRHFGASAARARLTLLYLLASLLFCVILTVILINGSPAVLASRNAEHGQKLRCS